MDNDRQHNGHMYPHTHYDNNFYDHQAIHYHGISISVGIMHHHTHAYANPDRCEPRTPLSLNLPALCVCAPFEGAGPTQGTPMLMPSRNLLNS